MIRVAWITVWLWLGMLGIFSRADMLMYPEGADHLDLLSPAFDNALLPQEQQMNRQVRKVQQLMKNGKFDEAERMWAELVAQYPDNIWVYGYWGGALLQSGKDEQARRVLTQALSMDSENPIPRFYLACLDVLDGQQHNIASLKGLSIDEVGSMCGWAADDADILCEKLGDTGYGILCRNLLSPESRIAQRDLFFLDSETALSWQAHMSVINESIWNLCSAMQQQNWTNALRLLKSAKSFGLKTPARNASMIFCYYKMGNTATAKKAIDKLLENSSTHPAPLITKALFMLEEKEYAQAETYLRRALDLRPDDWRLTLHLAAALVGQQKKEGVYLFEEVQQAHPMNVAEELKAEQEYLLPLKNMGKKTGLLLKVHNPIP